MGYTTEFEGGFSITPALSAADLAWLNEFVGRRHDDSVLPSYYCQWAPNADGTGIGWDGGEKFYGYKEWLTYLIANFFKPRGYVLNGHVSWLGEESSDRGVIRVDANVLRSAASAISNPLL